MSESSCDDWNNVGEPFDAIACVGPRPQIAGGLLCDSSEDDWNDVGTGVVVDSNVPESSTAEARPSVPQESFPHHAIQDGEAQAGSIAVSETKRRKRSVVFEKTWDLFKTSLGLVSSSAMPLFSGLSRRELGTRTNALAYGLYLGMRKLTERALVTLLRTPVANVSDEGSVRVAVLLN